MAGGAAGLVAPLLAACDKVIAGLLTRGPATVVLIGSGEHTGIHSALDSGTLAGFGTESWTVGTGSLPLSLTIGRWLLDRAGWSGDIVLQEIAAGTSAEACERLGAQLAADTVQNSVWLALGDGSNRRGPRSPGHDHPQAADFDADVARAFATADLPALLGLDSDLATTLGAAGRPVWQVLAAGVTQMQTAEAAVSDWTAIDATVHYDDAPFGVEYLVADWSPRS